MDVTGNESIKYSGATLACDAEKQTVLVRRQKKCDVEIEIGAYWPLLVSHNKDRQHRPNQSHGEVCIRNTLSI